jgi:hypothetical protein
MVSITCGRLHPQIDRHVEQRPWRPRCCDLLEHQQEVADDVHAQPQTSRACDA